MNPPRPAGGLPAALFAPWALRLSRWALGAVMLYAAWPKIADPPGFAQAVHGYGLLPMAAIAPTALLLPWVEACSAAALIAGPGRRAGAALVLAAMLVFSAALGINLVRGNPVDCGCFGASKLQRTREERLGEMRLALLRDLALALLAVHTLLGASRRGRNGSPRPDPGASVPPQRLPAD